MAKTYNTLTSDVTAGSVLTATAYNQVLTNVRNYRVPPLCRVRRSGSNSGAITPSTSTTGFLEWNTQDVDTEDDDMWTSGANTRITVRTAGLYLVHTNFSLDFSGTLTTKQASILHTTSGGTDTVISTIYGVLSQGSVVAETMTATFAASVGDYFRVRVELMTGASSITLRNSPACTFSAAWLGQVS